MDKIRNVLVTGASGKLGRHLVGALLDGGYRVRATQFQTPVKTEGVEVVTGSIGDAEFVARALEGMDAVCHLATSKEDPAGFMDTSVRGTFNLLDAARKTGTIKQFLLASGDAALGIFFYPQPAALDENAPLRAYPGYYAFSKVLEETMCNQYAIQYGLPVTILRASWIQAEDDILAYMTFNEPNFGGPVWSEIAVTPEQKKYFETGENAVGKLLHPGGKPYVRHLVGVADVVAAFRLALGNPAAIGETFNIAAPSAFSYDVLAGYIAEKLDLPVVDFELAGYYDFEIDINKARSILGYRPEFDVFAMVDAAIEFRRRGLQRSPTKYPG